MLLRSSSNPALNSWLQHLEPDFNHRSFKSPTISLHSSNDSPKKISRASSESDLLNLPLSRRRNSLSCSLSSVAVEEDVEAEEIESRCLLFSSSGLDPCGVPVMMDAAGGGGGGGKICGGDGADNGGYYNGRDDTDVYYQNMIEMNPNNSLILANYAKYLKEVCGDVTKAEEYCSRAILANPNDGTALSMYADLIWETQKDESRAHGYFDQAVKASPDDCYVMASYARFLWDSEEDEEEEEHVSDSKAMGFSQQFPVAQMAAASWG